VVSYDADGAVYCRPYASDGAPLHESVRATNEEFPVETMPRVAMTAGQGFIVTWQGAGANDYDVFAQNFRMNHPPVAVNDSYVINEDLGAEAPVSLGFADGKQRRVGHARRATVRERGVPPVGGRPDDPGRQALRGLHG